jgi:signal transduction histidine kinase
MMTGMEGARAAVWRADVALALGLAGLAVNVAGAAAFSSVAPYVGFLELARATLPGVVLACAVVVLALLGRPSWWLLGPLGVASVATAGPWLGLGLQQRSAAWVAIGALGHLVAPAVLMAAVVHPDGRIGRRWLRWALMAIGLLGVAVVAVATVTYDPATWQWCRCVANPVALDATPASYERATDVLTAVHATVAVAGTAAFLLTTPRPLRRVSAAFGATLVVLAGAWLVSDVVALWGSGPEPSGVTTVSEAALVLLVVLMVAAYADQRPSRAHVADLLLAARGEHEPSRLRELVARAIGDPRSSVAWWDAATDEYRDHLDRPVAVPEAGVLPVVAGARPIALVLSDRLDALEPAVREAVAEALLLSSENRRLTAELQHSLEQVRDSRARILTASDETRRRIERDLHDGAQQLLVSTGIKLNLAAAEAGRGDGDALAAVLVEARAELNRALVELRNLASGIAPTALVHGGLAGALQELALRSPVPTVVRAQDTDGVDDGLAATAYFVAAECLTNAIKHAGATQIVVEVSVDSDVTVSVADDGRGGARLDGDGSGLRGLVDRVEAVGGRLDVTSGPVGTTVRARIPGEAGR